MVFAIDSRKLAAVDMAFLGPRLILAEFSIGVFGSAGLGIVTLVRSHSFTGWLFGTYLLFLGLNYIPLLVYAIDLARHGTARQEIAEEEFAGKERLFRKYRRMSLWLLVPLFIPIVEIIRYREPHISK
jgi:hypothetical protein